MGFRKQLRSWLIWLLVPEDSPWGSPDSPLQWRLEASGFLNLETSCLVPHKRFLLEELTLGKLPVDNSFDDVPDLWLFCHYISAYPAFYFCTCLFEPTFLTRAFVLIYLSNTYIYPVSLTNKAQALHSKYATRHQHLMKEC